MDSEVKVKDISIIPSATRQYLTMLQQFGQLTSEEVAEVLIEQDPTSTLADARREAAVRIFDRPETMAKEDWSVMFS